MVSVALKETPLERQQEDDIASLKRKAKATKFENVAVSSKFTGINRRDLKVVLLLSALACIVRLWRLDWPTSVVFDEVHFGGFASKYIKGRYFVDVHPPLAKILYALVGWLAGFNGDFQFKNIGDDYIEAGVPYVAMRMYPAILGAATVPIAYLTLRATGCAFYSAVFGACAVLFENALVTQSRLILLDAPLVFFTALSALSWTLFSYVPEYKAFSSTWWIYLTMTGLSLGAVLSCKWVGLFTYAWIGVLTIFQLWNLLGNKKVSIQRFVKHFLARAIGLIMIPVIFYFVMFLIQFLCLQNPGDGDGFMSPEFQATLNNKGLPPTVADISPGAAITIRHFNTLGGYLHSHPHVYPSGSKQQQITLYPHRDDNNIWIIERDPKDNTTKPFFEDGDVVSLKHNITHRRLHSHNIRAPVSEQEFHQEVSGYGFEGFEGDANDFFRIEIVETSSKKGPAQNHLRAIDTKFRLVHVLTSCNLFSHDVKYPDWGFKQQEVTCAKNSAKLNSIWYIESNSFSEYDDKMEKVQYSKLSSFGKFLELNKVMWNINKGLTESHIYESRPLDWPQLRRGINFWVKQSRQIYLLGNPLLFWTTAAVLGVYLALRFILTLCWQRGFNVLTDSVRHYDYVLGSCFLGWLLHWSPFFLMERQLFLHHYLPALYFAILCMAHFWDLICTKAIRKPQICVSATVALISLVVFVFSIFSPLAYASKWTNKQCERAKWLSRWDFDCNLFPASIDDYPSITSAALAEASKNAEEAKKQSETEKASQKNIEVEKDKPKAAKAEPATKDEKSGNQAQEAESLKAQKQAKKAEWGKAQAKVQAKVPKVQDVKN